MANITYGMIVRAMDGLKKIADTEMALPTLYQVSKLLKQIDEELKFYNEKRQAIVDKYCTKVSDDKYQIDDQEAFSKAMTELDDIIIDGLTPVSIPSDARISLSYNTLRSLDGLINFLPTEV